MQTFKTSGLPKHEVLTRGLCFSFMDDGVVEEEIGPVYGATPAVGHYIEHNRRTWRVLRITHRLLDDVELGCTFVVCDCAPRYKENDD